ncbi:MAG: DUF4837 family protein [Cyclobacteriaceae bacterium]|nr:DUF4837 family protein [Cyclobacteriaceae bacterium]
MKRTVNQIIMVVFTFFILFSCNGDWMGEQAKPKGRGEPGEIVLVLDSARWAGETGSELRKIFHESVDGLPRDEPMFDLRHVNPFQFRAILKNAKNVILVVPVNDNQNESIRMRNFFTGDALDSMRENEDIFIITRKNLFATDQQVLFLIGHNDDGLVQKIKANADRMRSFFNRIEENRAYERLYKVRSERLIMNNLQKKYGFQFHVPFGWKIAEEKENFVWLRQPAEKTDKNIIVSFKPYKDQSQFAEDSLIRWRDQIGRKYIYEDPENQISYMITEPEIPPTIMEVNFNDNYAKKMIGRWKTRNVSMGGPFVSYVFVDENSGRMYYIEGFLFSPGVDQRELVRELDVILKTFKTGSEAQS